jgi:hypothetical protein
MTVQIKRLENVTYVACKPDDILHMARGIYQYRLLLGKQRISGADLQGKAKNYSTKYQHSRMNLLSRLRSCGYHCRIISKKYNKLHLYIIGDVYKNAPFGD